MSRVESEIYVNRALLWMLFAHVMRDHGNDSLFWVYVVMTAYCIWRSYKAFGDGE